ncbi:hypothetical protein QYE76_050968 [Lolium multiflorum]|uniref:Reverse transcriptase Ty1/copia-type domain-containing protein n=1 Tax=Lolium multiflorum TaxID=4521 RepID=A0AAD8SRT8_LOLMU|nr:hypothetical protein QYE76_050968 [Lolium multiflorum]
MRRCITADSARVALEPCLGRRRVDPVTDHLAIEHCLGRRRVGRIALELQLGRRLYGRAASAPHCGAHDPRACGHLSSEHPDEYACPASTSTPSPLPASARVALRDPHWFTAMQEEFVALQRNQTWQLVPRLRHANVITGKWAFKHKFHTDGTRPS